MNRAFVIRISVVAVLLLGAGVSLGNWPRFRGPNGTGVSDARQIPAKWTSNDYDWRISLGGAGPSSPVIWGDKLFVTAADASVPKGMLLAVDTGTGRVLWKRAYKLVKSRMNSLNSYAACTPALAEDRVYCLWSTANKTLAVALDHDGSEIWRRQFGPTKSSHGPGVSPMVAGELVVFTREQASDNKSLWVALDCGSGQTRWTVETDHGQISYSTPCIYEGPGGPEQLIFTSTTEGIAGVDPRAGEMLWQAKDAFIARVVSSPCIAGDLIVGSCGQGGGGKQMTAVRPPENADGEAEIAWKSTDRATVQYVPTSLHKDGFIYSCHDNGTVVCRKADSGQVVWSEKPAGRFYASPVWADGRLFCVTRDGKCVVLEAGPEYNLLAVNDLEEASDATPAFAQDRMYIRTESHLMRLGPEAK